jgi:hypothetical protein
MRCSSLLSLVLVSATGQDAGLLGIQVMRHHPVVLVVGLFGIAQHEAAGIDVGGADDLHALAAQFAQHGTSGAATEPLPVPAWMIALAPFGERAIGGVGHVAVAVGDIDRGRAVDLVDVELGVDGVALGRQAEPVVLAFDHHAERSPGALEGFGLDVDRLGDVAAAVDLVVHGDEHALAAASLLAATLTALNRLSMPSADMAVPGRIEPTTTMGLPVWTTRFRK